VALALIPSLVSSDYVLLFLAGAFVYAAFAGAWAIQSGFTGYLNLGYAMFVGLGAYTAANLDVRFGAPLWVTVSVGLGVAVIYSVLFGAATLRIKSHYIILATLAAVAAMETTAHIWRTYTHGEDGIPGITVFGAPEIRYYAALAFLVVCAAALLLLATSRHGLVLHAIRHSEDTARASGVDTVRYRLVVFTLSAAIGGAGGAMLIHILGYAGTYNISLELSLTILVYGVVGGTTSVLGPMVTAVVLVSLGEYLRAYGDFRVLMEAVILILAIRFMPAGLGPTVRHRLRRSRRGRVGPRPAPASLLQVVSTSGTTSIEEDERDAAG
jgi:branched-chain amino acid transport system permease protein